MISGQWKLQWFIFVLDICCKTIVLELFGIILDGMFPGLFFFDKLQGQYGDVELHSTYCFQGFVVLGGTPPARANVGAWPHTARCWGGVPFRKRIRQQGHEEAIGLDCAAADHPNLRCRHRSTSPWGCCYGARQARAVKAASWPPPGSLRLASNLDPGRPLGAGAE